jgi:hypothetical protein
LAGNIKRKKVSGARIKVNRRGELFDVFGS